MVATVVVSCHTLRALLILVAWSLAWLAGPLLAFAARRSVARWLRLGDVSFFPKRAAPGVPWLPWPRQGLVPLLASGTAYLLAALIFTVAYAIHGVSHAVPTHELPAIVYPTPNSPAQAAGLVTGDRIVSVGGTAITNWPELAAAIQKNAGTTVAIEIDRNGVAKSLTADISPEGRLGVRAHIPPAPVSLGSAIWRGVSAPALILETTVRQTYQTLLSNPAELAPAGPIRVVQEANAPTTSVLHIIAALLSIYSIPLALLAGIFSRIPSRANEEADETIAD